MSWHDNGWGFTNQMIRKAIELAKLYIPRHMRGFRLQASLQA
jgi:hypothetical protein